jgi:hypothetical protein
MRSMAIEDQRVQHRAAEAQLGRHSDARACQQENSMNRNWNALRLATAGLTAVLFSISGDAISAAAPGVPSRSGPVGTWTVQVTLRDCATNAPLGPPFNSLVSIHRDGTISESVGGTAFAPGQRSAGHGAWEPIARHTYSQQMIALVNFDTPANLPGVRGFNPALPVSPGFFAGWSTVTHTITLVDADHLTSSGTNQFFKANGDLYRSGCSTAVAQRFD